MEMIIEELMRIETSAREIIDEARSAENQLNDRISAKTEEVTRQAEAGADAEIAAAREKASGETREALTKIQASAQRWLSALQAQYAQNHQAWEDEIFEKIIQ